MPRFDIRYTGDYLDEKGAIGVGDIALDLYDGAPFIGCDFLRDQSPAPGDASYWDRLYSLEIEPHHVAAANGIVIFRPWVKASAFAEGADNLVVIGRAGAGDRQDRPRRLHGERRRRVQRARYAHPCHRLLRLPADAGAGQAAAGAGAHGAHAAAGTCSRRPWAPTCPARRSASSASAPAAANSPASPRPWGMRDHRLFAARRPRRGRDARRTAGADARRAARDSPISSACTTASTPATARHDRRGASSA